LRVLSSVPFIGDYFEVINESDVRPLLRDESSWFKIAMSGESYESRRLLILAGLSSSLRFTVI
jgi:hypothetical protein